MENREENSEKIWRLWKKGNSNSENIMIIQKKIAKRYVKYGKKSRLNSEMIWKIQKKILK
jgi:hypothetical protein